MGKDLLDLLKNYSYKKEKQIIQSIINLRLEDYDLTTEGHDFYNLIENLLEKMYAKREQKISDFKTMYEKVRGNPGSASAMLLKMYSCGDNSIWCNENREGLYNKRKEYDEIIKQIKEVKISIRNLNDKIKETISKKLSEEKTKENLTDMLSRETRTETLRCTLEMVKIKKNNCECMPLLNQKLDEYYNCFVNVQEQDTKEDIITKCIEVTKFIDETLVGIYTR